MIRPAPLGADGWPVIPQRSTYVDPIWAPIAPDDRPADLPPDVDLRPVPGHPGYWLGSDRSVWSRRVIGRTSAATRQVPGPWRRLNIVTERVSSPRVTLKANGRRLWVPIADLVLLTFPPEPAPEPPEKAPGVDSGAVPPIRPTDPPCPVDTSATAREVLPPITAGDVQPLTVAPTTRGADHGRAKLTELDVLTARQLHADGVGYHELAKRFGVGKVTLWHAVSGRTWSHLPMPAPRPKPEPKLCRPQLGAAVAAEIRQLHAQGWSYRRLAKRFGRSPVTVWKVLTGQTWTESPPA